MSAEHFQAPDAPGFKLDPRVVAAFGRFAGGFWTSGQTTWSAWALTLGLATFLALSVLATYALNLWNRWFFDSLEARNVDAVSNAVLVFPLIIVWMAAVGVGTVLSRETLQVRWRAWIVRQLVGRWLGNRRFYHLNITGKEPPNPEYRISDDTRWATEPLVDLGIGLVQSLGSAALFISVLWTVGGSISLDLGAAGDITIPGYMMWMSLAYGAIASGLMLWVGAPLVGFVGRKNEAEGYFRFAMMRVRDNAESVALMNGGRYEQAILDRFYDTVVARWMAMVWRHGRLTWITNASGPMIQFQIVPLLFAAPKYLSGDLTLGQVTQLAFAFVQVQLAISWVVDNFNRIAEWYASARRVMDIVTACDAIDGEIPAPATRPREADAAKVSLNEVAINDGNDRRLISGASLATRPGEAVHISGESSTGKSVLVRVLSGLWPCAGGSVTAPDIGCVMIVPQKSYLPLGSLKGALFYPEPDLAVGDDKLAAVLERVGLAALAARLDEVARWDQVLANGERQRLAVARLLLHKPQVVILDDALSALEDEVQEALLARIRSDLPGTIIVSLAQRPAPDGRYDRQLVLERGAEGAVLMPMGARALVGAT
ncbi:MAG TPA: ABC transporter ATP-binding protein/permease [Hyphomicrobiaceae bacterium]|jgi:putative ATP-binding cassette transporter|nr:ABC transporter ATP-binding protein/permease [Hyphomicrobiaceae bacterium]